MFSWQKSIVFYGLLLLASSLCAQQFSNLIVFGDGLSDIGNNTWAPAFGYSNSFNKGAPITNLERKTQRPLLWPQYLVRQGYFTESTILPSMQWHGSDLDKTNVDYAWVNAETGKQYLNDLSKPVAYSDACRNPGYVTAAHSCVPGLRLQVREYLSDVKLKHQQPGKHTLFVIWVGQNDIVDNAERFAYRLRSSRSQPGLLFHSSQWHYDWFPTENIYSAVETLINAEVPPQHIVAATITDVSIFPGVQAAANKYFNADLFLTSMRQASRIFNLDLQHWLTVGIRGEQKPVFLNVSLFFNKLVHDKQFLNYSFKHTNKTCVEAKATPYCDGYLFFNSHYPTTLLQAFFANAVHNQLQLTRS